MEILELKSTITEIKIHWSLSRLELAEGRIMNYEDRSIDYASQRIGRIK